MMEVETAQWIAVDCRISVMGSGMCQIGSMGTFTTFSRKETAV